MTNRKPGLSMLTLLAGCALLALPACQTTGSGIQKAQEQERSDKITAALERAAEQAGQQGNKTQSMAILERLYKRNNTDPEAAMKYAAALREAEHLNRAKIILSPFVLMDDADPALVSEYATINLAMGNYDDAEAYARAAILKDEASYKAYHVLGIALDAQGYHQQAEVAFRKGLDYWMGDPIPIMNNLALNLVSQGFFDEATEILTRAAAAAPNRPEVERNLRIVMTLKKNGPVTRNKPPPKPPVKPELDG